MSLLVCCNTKKQNQKVEFKGLPASNLSGKELAIAHCSRCHGLVTPELLPKSSWQDVLPAMGHRMGIYSGGIRPDSLFDPKTGGEVVHAAGIYPETPVLAKQDWEKIAQYYMENAPDSISPPLRKSRIRIGLKHFKYRETNFSHRPSLTTMVKILPDKRGIVFSDGKNRRNVLTFLTSDLRENYTMRLGATPIGFYEKSDTLFLTTIENGVFPTDNAHGAVHRLVRRGLTQGYQPGATAIANLRRPVFVAYGDLNKDGHEDVVACEFGNETGQLAWYENSGRGSYQKRILNERPGAISAVMKVLFTWKIKES